MPLEKVLIEYAKLHLQLIAAQEQIAELGKRVAQLEAQNKSEDIKTN